MGMEEPKGDLSFEELCRIVTPIAEKYGADGIYLFGSRARGDNSVISDYDFYVIRGRIRGLALCGLHRELEETLGSGVDIVTSGARLSDDFLQEVLRDRRLVYEA
ncbi:MAG: nucleotidyltransferase domain-containing protein [Methanomassiliicoccaceae archaeon]|nr:nucleotidyltransferase domain-containing protein [Methanomassiliicoccaceae archaeon]